jgi:hypothetical protein
MLPSSHPKITYPQVKRRVTPTTDLPPKLRNSRGVDAADFLTLIHAPVRARIKSAARPSSAAR